MLRCSDMTLAYLKVNSTIQHHDLLCNGNVTRCKRSRFGVLASSTTVTETISLRIQALRTSPHVLLDDQEKIRYLRRGVGASLGTTNRDEVGEPQSPPRSSERDSTIE